MSFSQSVGMTVISARKKQAMPKAEEQRKRHRDRARHRYYRSLLDVNESRALVQQLLTKRSALLSQCQEPVSTALQQYVGAIELVDELREEKQGLMELANERDAFQHRVTHILGDWDTFVSAHDVVARTMARPSMSFRPLSVQDCKELASSYYSNIQRSMGSQSSLKPNKNLFGWSERTQVNGLCINFSLQKEINGFTPSELLRRMWQVTVSTTEYPRMYSSVLTSTMECLQVVDEDNIVTYERLSRSDTEGFVHSLFLASRFPIENGFAQICQPLDASRLQWVDASDAEAVWIDTDFWAMYQNCDGRENATRVTSGGTINGLTDEDKNFWMLELLLIAMRLENLVVGPRFSLTNA